MSDPHFAERQQLAARDPAFAAHLGEKAMSADYSISDYRANVERRVRLGIAKPAEPAAPRPAAPKLAPQPAVRELTDAQAQVILRHTGVDPRGDSEQQRALDRAFGLEAPTQAGASFDARTGLQSFGGAAPQAARSTARPRRGADVDRSDPEVSARLDAAMGLTEFSDAAEFDAKSNVQTFGDVTRKAR